MQLGYSTEPSGSIALSINFLKKSTFLFIDIPNGYADRLLHNHISASEYCLQHQSAGNTTVPTSEPKPRPHHVLGHERVCFVPACGYGDLNSSIERRTLSTNTLNQPLGGKRKLNKEVNDVN